MNIDINHDINRVIASLPKIHREVVPKAVVPALNRGIQKSYSLAVKYAAKDFGRKMKEIRKKKIVTKIGAKRGDWSSVVYFNEYPETMTVEKFYTEADANSNKARPSRGYSVHGKAFTFTPTKGNSTSEIWAKRSTSKRRIDNVWKSSALHVLKYKRSVRNAQRVARIYARAGRNVFLKRLTTHEIPRQLKKAGF